MFGWDEFPKSAFHHEKRIANLQRQNNRLYNSRQAEYIRVKQLEQANAELKTENEGLCEEVVEFNTKLKQLKDENHKYKAHFQLLLKAMKATPNAHLTDWKEVIESLLSKDGTE